MIKRLVVGTLLLLTAAAASAGGIVNPSVDGNRVTATVSLAGSYEATLTMEFQSAVGLTVQNLGLSASLVNPNSISLVNRFPDASLISGLASFPVKVTIDPPSTGGLSFTGPVSVELYTHNLSYDPTVPLRLFSAEPGSTFHDITERVSSGSYRVRGSKGEFSEFLILLDTRGSSDVITDKFSSLNGLISQFSSSMSSSLASQLQGYVDNASAASQAGQYDNAISDLDDFIHTVDQAADAGNLPNVWRSARDLDNVAGLLDASAATLRFSLSQAANGL